MAAGHGRASFNTGCDCGKQAALRPGDGAAGGLTARRVRVISYDMSRERPAGTEERILAALVDVLVEGGLPGFSVQQVADRAGVSHRTVYRYFPTRESLLAGLTEWVDARMAARGGVTAPASAAEIPAAARTNFALFSRDARAVEAAVRFGVGAALETPGRALRTESLRELIVRELERDPERGLEPSRNADAALGAAVVRHLVGSRTWLALREIGLGDDEAGRAVAWAAAVLLDALCAGRLPGARSEIEIETETETEEGP